MPKSAHRDNPLDSLHPRGTRMADVHPDFRGINYPAWVLAQVTAQAASEEAQAYWRQFLVNGEPRLAGQRLWNKRDDYGMKGVR